MSEVRSVRYVVRADFDKLARRLARRILALPILFDGRCVYCDCRRGVHDDNAGCPIPIARELLKGKAK